MDCIIACRIHLKEVLELGVERRGRAELKPAKYRVILADRTYRGEIQVGITFTPKVNWTTTHRKLKKNEHLERNHAKYLAWLEQAVLYRPRGPPVFPNCIFFFLLAFFFWNEISYVIETKGGPPPCEWISFWWAHHVFGVPKKLKHQHQFSDCWLKSGPKCWLSCNYHCLFLGFVCLIFLCLCLGLSFGVCFGFEFTDGRRKAPRLGGLEAQLALA